MMRVFRPLGWYRTGYKVPDQEYATAAAFEKLWAKIFRIYTVFFLVLIITFQVFGVVTGLSGALLIVFFYQRSVVKTFAHYPKALSGQRNNFLSDYIRSRASALSYGRLIIFLVTGIVLFVYFSMSVLSPNDDFLVQYVGNIAGAIFGLAGIADTTVKLITKMKYQL